MNENTFLESSIKLPGWLNKEWLKGKSKRSIQLNVPVELLRERLEQAFASPIVSSSGGFLSAKFTYTAQIDGNNIYLQYSKAGRGGMSFNMTGHFFGDASATILEISVTDNMLTELSMILIGYVVTVIFHPQTWPLLTILLVTFYGLTTWNRNDAARMITRLLEEIVTKEKE